MANVRLDTIGYWSEVKLDMVRKYAAAYSRILSRQTGIRAHLYIDGFAGPGVHISSRTGDFVQGSPLNALKVEPPFSEYHFIDLDGGKAAHLRELVGERSDVHVYEGDCNEVLLKHVFPRARYNEYRRALCLLDPYKINLHWEVIRQAGSSGSIEIFLNFMVMDMNRNVLWRNPDGVSAVQQQRMNRFWGDDSWRQAAYDTKQNLFGLEEKNANDQVAEAFRQRLERAAGFGFVPAPMPMRNSTGAVIYYLFFASPNRTGAKIVQDIFSTYRNREVR